MASKRERIPLNAPQAPLNTAFAGLELSGLPAGPAPGDGAAAAPNKPKPGRVVLRKETAGRGGKAVLVVDDFASHFQDADLHELAARLRKACGCGGAVKGRTIELQGEAIARVRAELAAQGFQVAGVK